MPHRSELQIEIASLCPIADQTGVFQLPPGATNFAPVSGSVVHGYLSGAHCFCGYVNHNGVLDQGESWTITDAIGHFALADAVGPLVAFGGVDISTGLQFTGTLSAAEGSTRITPLTTLVALADQQGSLTPDDQVKSSFGLSSSLDLGSLDPFSAVRAGDDGSAAALVANLVVMSTSVAISAAIAGTSLATLNLSRQRFSARSC